MTILLISSVIAILVYFCFSIVLVVGILRLKPGSNKEKTPISIVVAAHNEADNISSCLKSLLAQSYPKSLTEIIVVNDRSEDNTGEQIDRLIKGNIILKSIYIDSVPDNISPKKYALDAGIKLANGEIILTTDADCRPPKNWAAVMVNAFDPDTGIAIGPAPFENGAALLRRYQNADHIAATLVSAGGAGWNIGITCTGRNLAYRKKAFLQVGGFEFIKGSLSGDDDLLLQRISRTTNWKIVHILDRNSKVVSNAAADLRQYITQRRRHLSAGKMYTMPLKAAYLVFNVANAMLFLFFLSALIRNEMIWHANSLLMLKLLLDYIVLSIPAHKIQHTLAISDLLLWEFGFIVNQLFIGPTAFTGRLKWK